MHKKTGFALRAICLGVLLAILTHIINNVLVPKKYFDNMWPTTSTYKGLYEMKRDTVDILFFGSSHAASGFCPQVMYNSRGIRSYNLACEQQNLLVSYYWLLEAMRYQSPEVVVLDPYVFFNYNKKEALNTQESCTRMAMDPMRWSKVKWTAVNDICRYDTKQSLGSYILRNVRFHDRWTELSEQDFSSVQMQKHYELKGYAPLSEIGKYINIDYAPMDAYNTEDVEEPNELMKVYMDKMVEVCKDRGIDLVLVKTPSNQWFYTRHNAIQRYADDKGLIFIDFNDKKYYDNCGFVFKEDMHDVEHANIWGADKITRYLADYLVEHIDSLANITDEQWEAANEYYNRIVRDCTLKHIDNIDEYFNAINEDRYAILIAVKNDLDNSLIEDMRSRFNLLGLEFNITPGENYAASIYEGKRYEEGGMNSVKISGSTRNKRTDFVIISGGAKGEKECSIILDNCETSLNKQGINFVVYDNETWKIIDSMSYDGSINR